MSYTNNVYIFYIEEFHDEKNFLVYKNYYTDLGFNVKTFGCMDETGINYSKSINNLFIEENEDIFIIIDNIIIPNFAIHQAINLCMENKTLIKPTNKTYIIENKDQAQKIINSLIEGGILENFNYSNQEFCDIWPLGGSWVINSKNIKELFYSKYPTAFDFDLCYKFGTLDSVIFIKSDSYKINPSIINIDENILFIYESYIQSMINFLGLPTEVFLCQNQVLKKIDECVIQEDIFNIKKYFSKRRYI